MVEIVQLKWFPLIFKNVNAIYISYWLKSFLHETANVIQEIISQIKKFC